MAKETMAACATRHMMNGVNDLDELTRMIGQDLGDVPNIGSVRKYRALFKKHGAGWIEERNKAKKQHHAKNPEAGREATRRWNSNNPEKVKEAKKQWNAANPEKVKEAKKQWNAANPETRKETHKRWEANNPARKLLNSCRGSAKLRGHECTITLEDVEKLLAPMVCSVTGLSLTFEARGESEKYRWFAPSLDRIDNSIGYVLDNVRLTSVAFNKMRSDLPDQVLLTIAKALVGSTHH